MTLEDFRAVFTGSLIGNCGYDRDSAEAAIERGAADLIAIGRPFIANPDLIERYANDLPLAESDPAKWYAGGDDESGYTDYPRHDAGVAAG